MSADMVSIGPGTRNGRPGRDPHAPPPNERAALEQRLMRVGRKLQSLGQLLEQAPTRIIAKGYDPDPEITGERPVQIEMEEMRALFDLTSSENVGSLLHTYHQLLRQLQRATT